jgi:sarcosine oxidase subunit beta
MSMTTDGGHDAIIIGAGVLGCAIALEMSRRGKRTLNLDKAASAGAGSTSNSCAIIRFTYSTKVGVALSWEGGQYWKDWAAYVGAEDELGLIEFHEVGQLNLFTDDAERLERVHAIWDDVGIPYEYLGPDELGVRFPYMDFGWYGPPTRPDDPAFWKEAKSPIKGALWSPDAGYVSDPQLSCHNMQRGAEALGGEFRFKSEVASILTEDGVVSGVKLADGSSAGAPVVINVAGPHSLAINKMAGVYDEMNIKTAALRHEVHHVPAPAGVDFASAGTVGADDDIGFYFRPEVGNNVLLGSVDAACDPSDYVDPDDYDKTIDREQWHTQVLRATRRMPDMGMPHDARGIVDLYDVSDDWLPIYDRTALDGFYVAIGTSGNQYKNAGAVGQAMADLVEAVSAGHDHDNDPVQVVGRYTGLTIDLGAYSRNREINADSSMSVHG